MKTVNTGGTLLLSAVFVGSIVAFGASDVALRADTALQPGQTMNCGDSIFSSPGGNRLFCENFGSSFYLKYTATNSCGAEPGRQWNSLIDVYCAGSGHIDQGSTAHANGRLVMQFDGNLVLLNGFSSPVWASQTDGSPGSFLNVQDDGNLVIYNASSVPIWSLF